MNVASPQLSARILLIDDNAAIHEDFRKVLVEPVNGANEALDRLEADLFGTSAQTVGTGFQFEVDSAFQGEEGLERVKASIAERRPYAMAFVDMRMPPGWDGLETVCRLWQVAPELQVVICTAYSDYSWSQMLQKLERHDGLLILKKPFDNIEVLQMAQALSMKSLLERQVKGQLANLEAAVRERTVALTSANVSLRQEIERRQQAEQQLVESQKLEGLGLMAAGIAHEINNPMAFVTANVASLQQDLQALEMLPTILREYVEEVLPETLDGIRRVNAIVADVRRFARADAGENVSYDLNTEVKAALRLVRGKMTDRHAVELALGEVPPLLGKPNQIGQVIVNLLVNAIHATAEGGLIQVTTSYEGEDVVLSVRDNGSGIPEAIRSKLFQPFFTTKPVGAGTGL
ncbi:MAG: ATP-binding protein, partial [Thaumarchaeota archaeon]|nr:ATP-binding protein [Nitrososphaerota archaeon]